MARSSSLLTMIALMIINIEPTRCFLPGFTAGFNLRRSLGVKVATCCTHTSRIFQPRMVFGWEGYENSDRKKNGIYPSWALAGSWKLQWEDEDAGHQSVLVALDSDGTCRPPENGAGDAVGFSGSWRLKGDQVTVKLRDDVSRSLSGLAVTVFQGRMLNATEERPYGSMICGNVLDGEIDPSYVGKFNLTQVVGGASMGMGPGKPAPVQSRASQGFSMTSRSDAKVLERFSDIWEGSINMDGTRAELSVQLHSNGSFETLRYSKITTEGMKSGGVLRGRWNVYYSEPQDKDRFWMQILRLKSSGVNLWSDLLLLGDLRPVHTWRDLESQLLKQTMEMQMQHNESSNASAIDQGEKEAGGPAEQEAGEEDETQLEDRGVFTRNLHGHETGGVRRRYEISGTVITGHQFEPTIVGSFNIRMQAQSGDEADSDLSLEPGRMERGEGWERDLGLGGDEL